MFKVTVRGPDGAETQYPLGPDQGLIVGREEAADVVLPSKRVSRRHARIFTSEGKLYIEDLGSQNGVFVGGARVTSTSEIRPGPPIEVGEFNLTIRREDLTSPENSYAGILEGFGTTAGRTLNLPKERGVVGRDESADIVVLSDSVSRRHAELRYAGLQGYYIQDLGSANGTFVNGTRLPVKIERPLRPNDTVQFGDSGWIVVPKSAGSAAVTEKSRRRVLIFLMVFLIVLAGIVFYALQHLSQQQHYVEPERTRTEAAAIDRCHEALSQEQWADAQRACGQAYEEEPFLERRQLLRKAERELKFKQIFDDALHLASVGNDRDAVERFFQIDPSSASFAQARLKVQLLAKNLMKRDESECRESSRKREWEKALAACSHFLRYQCHNGVNQDVLKLLRTAEKERNAPEWQCPTQLAQWFSTGLNTTVDPTEYCKQNYTERDVCAAIVRYAHEQSEDAFRLLEKQQKKMNAAAYKALVEEIRTVEGQYKKGQSALSASDFVGGEAAYKEALANDARIMLDGHESDYAKEMKDSLSQHYLKQGQDAKSKHDLEAAYRSFLNADAYRPTGELSQLEQIGMDRLTRFPGCESASAVKHYTRPTSDAYKKAAEMAQTCGP